MPDRRLCPCAVTLVVAAVVGAAFAGGCGWRAGKPVVSASTLRDAAGVVWLSERHYFSADATVGLPIRQYAVPESGVRDPRSGLVASLVSSQDYSLPVFEHGRWAGVVRFTLSASGPQGQSTEILVERDPASSLGAVPQAHETAVLELARAVCASPPATSPADAFARIRAAGEIRDVATPFGQLLVGESASGLRGVFVLPSTVLAPRTWMDRVPDGGVAYDEEQLLWYLARRE